MKTIRPILLLPAVALGLALGALAQEPQATRRVPQLENDQVRVWKSIIMPHQPLSMQRHDHGRVIV